MARISRSLAHTVQHRLPFHLMIFCYRPEGAKPLGGIAEKSHYDHTSYYDNPTLRKYKRMHTGTQLDFAKCIG